MATQNKIQPRLVSVPQGAAYTGDSRSTLYKEWKAGNIAFVKMGGSTRIEFDELNRYIDAKKKDAA